MVLNELTWFPYRMLLLHIVSNMHMHLEKPVI